MILYNGGFCVCERFEGVVALSGEEDTQASSSSRTAPKGVVALCGEEEAQGGSGCA